MGDRGIRQGFECGKRAWVFDLRARKVLANTVLALDRRGGLVLGGIHRALGELSEGSRLDFVVKLGARRGLARPEPKSGQIKSALSTERSGMGGIARGMNEEMTAAGYVMHFVHGRSMVSNRRARE
jgi:hypothetical protein